MFSLTKLLIESKLYIVYYKYFKITTFLQIRKYTNLLYTRQVIEEKNQLTTNKLPIFGALGQTAFVCLSRLKAIFGAFWIKEI